MSTATQHPIAPTSAPAAIAYDDVPYDSFPFPQTNPLHAQGIAKLFGLDAPPPQTARILEIGCASGTNIMSIASCFPLSQCVGIDYSGKQIEIGQQRLKAVGLSNLELKHMSVMDVTKAFGTFDYIITHGVLSWVPQEVQDKIIEVSKTNLAPDGIAYISYNTLPGWNSVRSLRDMMIYHTSQYTDPATKVQQARWVLKFLKDSSKDNKSLLGSAVERELQMLEGQPDYYLLHDHLEENNHAFYFHEFMTRARDKGLQYLGDVSLELMFSGNLAAETAKVLATSNDVVRTEQFMDYINDRRFRQTFLCHSDRILNWNVAPKILKGSWLTGRFGYPEGFAQHDITSGQSLDFAGGMNIKLTTSDPLNLAMMKIFFEHKREPVSMDSLTGMVREKFKQANYNFTTDPGDEALEDRLAFMALRCLFMGGLTLTLSKVPCAYSVSSKPLASALARYQAGFQEWMSNQRQEAISLNVFDRALLAELDGTKDILALTKAMLVHFKNKKLVLNENNAPVEDMAVIRERLKTVIPERLDVLCQSGLLLS